MAAEAVVVGQVPSPNASSGDVSRVSLNAMAVEATVVGQVPLFKRLVLVLAK